MLKYGTASMWCSVTYVCAVPVIRLPYNQPCWCQSDCNCNRQTSPPAHCRERGSLWRINTNFWHKTSEAGTSWPVEKNQNFYLPNLYLALRWGIIDIVCIINLFHFHWSKEGALQGIGRGCHCMQPLLYIQHSISWSHCRLYTARSIALEAC